MEIIDFCFDLLKIPFANFIQTSGRLSWIYILSAFFITLVFLFLNEIGTGKFNFKKYLKRIFNFSNWFTESSLVDYIYYFLETILHTIFFSNFIISSLATSILVFNTMKSIWGEYSFATNFWINSGYTVLFLLAYDFSRFYIHKKMHDSKILWEFHKFHHSAKSLNYFTVYRVHPIESILLNSGSGIASGFVTGLFAFIFPAIEMYQFLGVNLGLFIFQLYSNLRHSETWISFPSIVSYILLSPAQHQIHHSINPNHFNKNLGVIFSFWDFIADTLYIPKESEDIVFGLPDETNSKDYTNLFRIFLMPFYKIILRSVLFCRKFKRLPPTCTEPVECVNTDRKYDR